MTIDKFLGIPYELGGRDFSKCDCMGIILLYLKENGIEFNYDPAMEDTFRNWWERNPRRFMDYIFQHGTMVRFSEVQKFDVMFFLESGSIGNFPSWPGVMVDDRYFLTSFDKKESHIQMLNIEWKNRFWGAIRPKGNE